jgi:hypothetical protein
MKYPRHDATGRWRVIFEDGYWKIIDPGGVWHMSAENLSTAHTEATRLAIIDRLFEPGALHDFRWMVSYARAWEETHTGW